MVSCDAALEVRRGPAFVSRGGVKLSNALDAFGLSVEGSMAFDVGASTGGFTDCLLQRGAAHVIALDVAYGELGWKLREDPRVTVIERRNARNVTPDELPYAPGLIVIDVSFISLSKVLPTVLKCAAPRYDCLAMVKPQFEVGRERLGKGGVVRDPELRRAAVVDVGRVALALGDSRCRRGALRAAGTEGQPGDVPVAARCGPPGRRPGGGGTGGRAGRGVGAGSAGSAGWRDAAVTQTAMVSRTAGPTRPGPRFRS